MHKKGKKSLAAVNTEGWMMSYADMVTILLAMFIVLSTLGKDQTGASLQKGLESWRETTHSFGLGGIFGSSDRTGGFGHSQNNYNLNNDGKTNPDGENGLQDDKGGITIDQENEQFQRFLSELDRQFKTERLPHAVGQATVDLFDSFNKTSPYWTARQQELLTQIVPLLHRTDYRIVLVVWSPMAKESAMVRSSEKAKQLADELATTAQLDSTSRQRLISIAKTWPYVDYQRPIASLIVTRTNQANSNR